MRFQVLDILPNIENPVTPVVRKEAPTALWTDADPYGGRPACAGRQVPDAAAVVEAARRRQT